VGAIQDAVNTVNDTHIDWGTGTNQVSTADIPEETNLYYTDERAEDAVGGMIADTNTIDLTYTDATPELKADLKKQNSTTIDLSDDASGLKADLNSTLKTNYDAAYSHKTTEDAINGIVKCDGAGTYSSVTDSSSNWDTAYSHSGVTSGNPHSVSASDVGAGTAQWNADKIQGVTVDNTDIGDGKILAYNSTSGKLEYETISSNDEKVKIDAAATAGYIGADSNDGVLRTDSTLNYSDGGDYVTLSVPDNYVKNAGGDTMAPKLTISDSADIAPLNITERASAPSNPAQEDVYLDDGTNTKTGTPGFRRYTGSVWEDLFLSTEADVISYQARAYLSADQSGIVSGTETPIAFNATSYDDNGDFDKTNHYYVVPKTGYYVVSVNAWLKDFNDGDNGYLRIYKNSNSTCITSNQGVNTGTYLNIYASDIVKATANDHISATIKHFTGSNNTLTSAGLTTYIAIAYLGSVGTTGTDELVGIDESATAGYIGATAGDGVLRTSSPMTYTDGGDYITLSVQDGTTAQKGAVQLQDSIDTTATTAATPNAVKNYVDAAGGGGVDNQNMSVTYVSASTLDVDGDFLQVSDTPLSAINLTLDITTDGINGCPKTLKTGTATCVGTAVTGSGTAFNTEFIVGDVIYFAIDNVGRRITAIADSTNLTVESSATVSTGRSIYKGGEAPNTWYAICVAYNPTTSTTGGLLFPTEANATDNGVPKTSRPPILPSGYTNWRHIGWVRNNSSSNFYNPAYCIVCQKIVERGLEAGADWSETGSKAAINTDGNTHELVNPNPCDIVPPGAKAIEFKSYVIDNLISQRLHLWGYGRSNYSQITFRTVVSNYGAEQTQTVFPDYMRRIQYEGSNTAFAGIYLAIKNFVF